jgi:hypothetical protein
LLGHHVCDCMLKSWHKQLTDLADVSPMRSHALLLEPGSCVPSFVDLAASSAQETAGQAHHPHSISHSGVASASNSNRSTAALKPLPVPTCHKVRCQSNILSKFGSRLLVTFSQQDLVDAPLLACLLDCLLDCLLACFLLSSDGNWNGQITN